MSTWPGSVQWSQGLPRPRSRDRPDVDPERGGDAERIGSVVADHMSIDLAREHAMKHIRTNRTALADLATRPNPRRVVLLAMAIAVFAVGCTASDPRLDDGSRSDPGSTAASAHFRTASS